MIFNSVTYVAFLLGVVPLYWALPLRARQWLVLIASICFYGFWRFDFAAVMLVSAATDFIVSLRLHRCEAKRARRAWLAVSLLINLGLLFYFKYLGFALDNGATVAGWFGIEWSPAVHVLLPLGISFYTFQTISYTVDVYRRRIEPLRDFVLYGSYVTFFPQLVAGPILRASEVVSQLSVARRFGIEDFTIGVRRILFGLLLKVGFADHLAVLVDAGFAEDPNVLSAIDVWTLSFLFGFQIYFDFAGYSHIALGSGRLMGIVFPENFNFPYLASSPKDFWRRWHISLSSWIRDYLYLPLVGATAGTSSQGGLATELPKRDGRSAALFIAWGIMGLWHGAAWTFLWWGLYHAVVVYAHRLLSGRLPRGRVMGVLRWGTTLSVIMLGWVPFRATSPEQAYLMWARLLQPRAYTFMALRENAYLIAAVTLLVISVAGLVRPYLTAERFARRPLVWWPLQLTAYAGLTAVVFTFLRPLKQFIYFQF